MDANPRRRGHALHVLRRAARLPVDVLGVVAAALRAGFAAFARPRHVPGLALVAGEPIARTGEPSSYRVRVCNPTAAPCALAVVAEGYWDGRVAFRLAWDVALGVGACAERWVETMWQDGAVLRDAPAETSMLPPAGTPSSRWRLEVHATSAQGDATRLRIGGVVVS